MTRAQALAEAQARWGDEADICDATGGAPCGTVIKSLVEMGCAYQVGKKKGHPMYWDVIGAGDSWEAAFADADATIGDPRTPTYGVGFTS